MARKDFTQIAFDVVQQAAGETGTLPDSAKAKAGRKGGAKGGASRATALTSKQRSEIAKKAALARWKKPWSKAWGSMRHAELPAFPRLPS
jgi:hypothetical protein